MKRTSVIRTLSMMASLAIGAVPIQTLHAQVTHVKRSEFEFKTVPPNHTLDLTASSLRAFLASAPGGR